MEVYSGKSVFSGIAIGTITVYQKEKQSVARHRVENAEAEYERVNEARDFAKQQLQELYDKAVEKVGESGAQIFEVHKMMLDDLDYLESIENMIKTQNVNAEYAVAETGEVFSKMFSGMEDEYMRARAADVKDISERLIGILHGNMSEGPEVSGPRIVFAEDLAPGETMQMDKSKVLSFVTRFGSANSHTAILARTMNIPALIGVDFGDDVEGKLCIVDGFNGKVYISPDDETVRSFEERRLQEEEKQRLLQELKGKDNVTRSGKRINVYANIGNVSDLGSALQNDAGGIGLFRSEFLYLEKDDYPTEEEQFQIYKKAAETMAGKKVIIRTLDIGADKQADYFDLGREENPALGYRAIRICLTRQDIFKTQLRALLRASCYGNIAVMYPMIISVEEVKQIKEIVRQVKEELTKEGIGFGEVEQGIMIETPAAVMISDLLAKEADFFSIGTNDLTQYTLAIDRQNAKLDAFYEPRHEAILRMIRMVVENAHKEGIWAGICGELGADLELTETFVEMGVDELSVTPPGILPLRDKIRQIP